MPLKPRTQRFEHVKSQLVDAILRGRFGPGDRLPSLRDLCDHFEVSLITVQRAVQELKDEEWLVAYPRAGVVVADPLPPMAHLLRLKMMRAAEAPAPSPMRDSVSPGGAGALTCLIHDEALLPAFEWAANEYAHSYAPYAMRFVVRSLRGRDDEDSARSIDADLALLPSYTVNWAAAFGAITPACGMLTHHEGRFDSIPPAVMDLLTSDSGVWGVPLFVAAPILVAGLDACQRYGLDWTRIRSVEALLAALEAAEPEDGETGFKLLSMAFPRTFLVASGHDYAQIALAPGVMAKPEVRRIMERLRALAQRPCVELNRFDQWDRSDLLKAAVSLQPSVFFCRAARDGQPVKALPIPGPGQGTLGSTLFSMCVSARSVHPYEAWEWAAHLAGAPFQARLAELGYDMPAAVHPRVREALARSVGPDNAAVLQDLVQRPGRQYGVSQVNTRRYQWEVLGNEVYRFIAGLDSYERTLERVATKTQRYLQRQDAHKAAAGATEGAAPDSPALAAAGHAG
ncbi:MAG TPA: GntR family transcriptional regulator [Candidatus Brocadiia bacterium]|nr:GntR family transcriptional regulator [Candidatus Brocadiia bacterium]